MKCSVKGRGCLKETVFYRFKGGRRVNGEFDTAFPPYRYKCRFNDSMVLENTAGNDRLCLLPTEVTVETTEETGHTKC